MLFDYIETFYNAKRIHSALGLPFADKMMIRSAFLLAVASSSDNRVTCSSRCCGANGRYLNPGHD
jgi:hypothetical protein